MLPPTSFSMSIDLSRAQLASPIAWVPPPGLFHPPSQQTMADIHIEGGNLPKARNKGLPFPFGQYCGAAVLPDSFFL